MVKRILSTLRSNSKSAEKMSAYVLGTLAGFGFEWAILG